MKKIVWLLIFVITGFEVKAQRELLTYEELKSQVLEMNALMPMSLGFSMQMTSADIDREKMTYFVSLMSLSKDVKINSPETIKNTVIAMLSSPSADMKYLLRSLMALNIQLRYVLDFPQGGKSIEICLTSNDMDRIINDKYSPEEKLDMYISSQLLGFPLDAGQGIVLVDFRKKDNYVEYVGNVDETIIDMNDLILAKEQVKQNIIQLLRSDMVSRQQMELMSNAGYGMAYLYVGGTTKTALRIEIPVHELKATLNNNDPLEKYDADYSEVDSIAVDDDYWDDDTIAVEYDSVAVDSVLIDSVVVESALWMNYKIDDYDRTQGPIRDFLGKYEIENDTYKMLHNYCVMRKRRVVCAT